MFKIVGIALHKKVVAGMSVASSTGNVPDDNLLTRKKNVQKTLALIKEKKEKLVSTMRTITSNEEPDKELLAQLIDAYEQMTSMENQYLEIMRNIVDIHERATDDVEKEIAATASEVVKPHEAQTSNEDATEDELELKATLKELQEVSQQAIAASILNERLVERLQLHKNKKHALDLMRKDKAQELRSRANAALSDVEAAREKVTKEKSAADKKQRELDSLRKQALKEGMKLCEMEQQVKENLVKEVEASTDEANRVPRVENDAPPPLPTSEPPSIEEKRRQIRENVRKERERKEEVNRQIREKLAAMEARKERMKKIRAMLTQGDEMSVAANDNSVMSQSVPGLPSDDGVDPKLDHAAVELMFLNASRNLENLTAMRQHLESLQTSDETRSSSEVGADYSSPVDDEVEESS